MKILHLLSDWKWTGPAEPVVSLCEALTRRGVDITLAYRRTPIEFHERTVAKEVQKRDLRGFEGFRLNRYFSVKDWLYDFKAIRAFAGSNGIDVLHAHLSHDHVAAVASLLFLGRRPLLIRTDHKRDGLPYNPAMAQVMARTDGLVTYSERIRQHDVKAFRFPLERSGVVPPGVNLYDGPVEDVKASLGIKGNERVIGVIGRLKRDRGYDVILNAFRRLRDRLDRVKLVIVGRSSQVDETIRKPIDELGLQNDVIVAGYHVDDYFSVIAGFDLFVMMRAGSDGTARALREVMGMGKPAIVSSKGMLPELVTDGQNGYVVDLDAGQLADRMEQILRDDRKRERFGTNARETARTWDYATQAERMVFLYEKMMSLGRRR